MALTLDFSRVQYECICGAYWPSAYLYYCVECSKPRCHYCVLEELDTQFYCSSCLEDTKINDSRAGYCSNCYLCPLCGITLSQRATNEGHFLHCSSCMWTTHDIGLKPKSRSADWVPPTNPMESKLNEISAYLKNLAIASGRHNTEIQLTRKTLSNLGNPASNKYGLSKSLQARSRQIFKKVDSQSTLPTTEIPGLDPSIFTEEVNPSSILKLDQELALVQQYGQMYPVRKPLGVRRLVRCPDHDILLYRAEYSLLSTVPKNYYPPLQCCPEVKFSHEVEFSATDEFSVFLSISNWTSSPLVLTIVPIQNEDPNCLKCLNTEPIEVMLSKKDGTATDDELISGQINLKLTHDPNEIGSIVFNQRHRIGIHLKCEANKETKSSNAYLTLKICFHREEKPETIHEQRVKVFVEKQY